jgi:hypothetical protein
MTDRRERADQHPLPLEQPPTPLQRAREQLSRNITAEEIERDMARLFPGKAKAKSTEEKA